MMSDVSGNHESTTYLDFLKSLENKVLIYGIKSPDLDLYDFGFGDDYIKGKFDDTCKHCTHILHPTCRFLVICQETKKWFDEYTEPKSFEQAVNTVLGARVKQAKLGKSNDLILDFDNFRVILFTFDDNEESWRLFLTDKSMPHLVVSNSWIEFQ